MLDNLISEHIPGAVLLVETKNGSYLGSAGFKDLKKKKPMTTDVVMPNGSAGKKLTALLVAMLADEGVLSLDAPISSYLENELLSQIQYSDKMTLRQLLNHTSGIFEYNDAGEYDFFKAQYAQKENVTTDMFPLKFAFNNSTYTSANFLFVNQTEFSNDDNVTTVLGNSNISNITIIVEVLIKIESKSLIKFLLFKRVR